MEAEAVERKNEKVAVAAAAVEGDEWRRDRCETSLKAATDGDMQALQQRMGEAEEANKKEWGVWRKEGRGEGGRGRGRGKVVYPLFPLFFRSGVTCVRGSRGERAQQ